MGWAQPLLGWLYEMVSMVTLTCRLRDGFPGKRVAVMIEGMYAVYRDEENAQKRVYREQVLNVCFLVTNAIDGTHGLQVIYQLDPKD